MHAGRQAVVGRHAGQVGPCTYLQSAGVPIWAIIPGVEPGAGMCRIVMSSHFMVMVFKSWCGRGQGGRGAGAGLGVGVQPLHDHSKSQQASGRGAD